MWIAVTAIVVVAATYLGALALAASLQNAMLFPVRLATLAAEKLPDYAERIEVRSEGETLTGVRLRPRPGSALGPLIIGFGGNAWNADSLALYLGDLFETAEIVTFHFRGYPPSTGNPGAAAMLADTPAIFDAAAAFAAGRPIVVVGFSIGAGVAAYLASQRKFDGLILVSPFDSLHALAREHYPWAPVGLFLRHRIDTAAYLRDSAVPLAIIAAGLDSIVPPRRTGALVIEQRHLAFQRVIAGADHNDLYGLSDFAGAMLEALDRVLAAAGKPINNPNQGR